MPIIGREPGRGLVYLYGGDTSLGSSGPMRVDTSQDNPEPKLPPLGFTSREEYEEALYGPTTEPLLWEGD